MFAVSHLCLYQDKLPRVKTLEEGIVSYCDSRGSVHATVGHPYHLTIEPCVTLQPIIACNSFKAALRLLTASHTLTSSP